MMNQRGGVLAVMEPIAPREEPPQGAKQPLRERPVRARGSRPRSFKRYMRERLAAALPEIADSLIKAAIGGKIAELKMLLEMSGLNEKDLAPDPLKRRGKTLEEMLMDDWRKEPADASIYKG